MEPAYIQLRNVWKSFEDQLILAGIDLDVHRGETVGILGKSGTGKSVTLKLISGLLPCDKGTVLVNGEDLAGKTEEELLAIRKKISYVFQSGALFDSISLFDNIAYPLLEQVEYEYDIVEARVHELASMLDVEDYLQEYPSDITLGVKKRVAIARALATEPDALLYDEPTTGLDPLMGKKISKLIRTLNINKKLTSVVVTHDIACIEIVSDKVAMLHEGAIRFFGTLKELQESPDEFIQEFLFGTNAFLPEPLSK
ncbi:MAG: hypothetical protein A2Y62_15065 [Candidatus Fischerbacteria bacterium RBG_13_37_8]|uniref:ABC transporter domain-containing protein n=1 Tax=Candidatus Fischerbacteria bacterium RBG_13_37_8 TaxID=1817863 RepID=A0A1F5V4Q8_9BACT|nr:MAG: hypothetical protein A2Y62_15065 [Candidatus Fischerbacteria bacterium RBG_13_37_8]